LQIAYFVAETLQTDRHGLAHISLRSYIPHGLADVKLSATPFILPLLLSMERHD
jgi:hypothetical protein